MSRKGRDLEHLVSILEKGLGPTGVKVKSPEYIRGVKSGSNREIDITLRSKVGSSNVLVIVECRNRDETEQVTWIEQLAKKKEDVEADKAVAVSTRGFSSGAISTAEHENIELRTLEEINPAEMTPWFQMRSFFVHRRMFGNSNIEIILAEGENFQLVIPDNLTNSSKVLQRKKDGSLGSILDVWNGAPLNQIYEEVPTTGEKVLKKVALNFVNLDDCYRIETTKGLKDIKEIVITAEVWIETKAYPLSSAKIYTDTEGEISKTAEFDFKLEDQSLSLGLHQISDTNQQFVTVRKKEL